MTTPSMPKLNQGAQTLVQMSILKQTSSQHPYLGVHHWLYALIERHTALVEALLPGEDINAIRQQLPEKLKAGSLGDQLPVDQVVQMAEAQAASRGKEQATERDMAVVILRAAGFQPAESLATPVTPSQVQPVIDTTPHAKPTPTLDSFGRDLTRQAADGKLGQIIGRDMEIQLAIETLCRRTKRNPCLVGPAGVGKTAIVEGIASRVQAGNVPDMLKGVRIIALQPSTLVAGANYSGELEKRMTAILQEASQESIILFIDEIHTIMGAGGMMGLSDIASILKPALARGDMACIAATTDDEYRRFIENDTALERRFQPIRVQEMSPEQTLDILTSLNTTLESKYQIKVAEGVLPWLVKFGAQYMRNRYFPDKAVDLLEQCFAHAVAQQKPAIDMAEAQTVAQRMIGMPLALEERLKTLAVNLVGKNLMDSDQVQFLLGRLQVTMRGLDLRSGKPNAMLLVSGPSRDSSAALAETIAAALYGSPERVVTIDLGRMTESHDITLLVGSPPGYVGYKDTVPLHKLMQTPWCVVRFENVDQCHPAIRDTLAQAFKEGRITDGLGRSIYFSDAILLITADLDFIGAKGNLGFTPPDDDTQMEENQEAFFKSIIAGIGEDLASQVDLVLYGLPPSESGSRQWLEKNLLADLSLRYEKQGMALEWDESLLDYLIKQQGSVFTEQDWEHWVDRALTPALIPYLPESTGGNPVKLKLRMEEGKLVVDQLT